MVSRYVTLLTSDHQIIETSPGLVWTDLDICSLHIKPGLAAYSLWMPGPYESPVAFDCIHQRFMPELHNSRQTLSLCDLVKAMAYFHKKPTKYLASLDASDDVRLFFDMAAAMGSLKSSHNEHENTYFVAAKARCYRINDRKQKSLVTPQNDDYFLQRNLS